jgi:titin
MSAITKLIRLVVAAIALAALGLVATLTVSAAPASAACYPPGSASCTPGLHSSTGTVAPGGTFTLSGTGFAPGATVTINVCNLFTLTTTADSNGSISVPITIPKNAPAGPCTITASGLGANGQELVLTTTIVITSGGGGGSTVPGAHTGEPWAGSLYWVLAGGASVLGFALVAIGRRRRPAETT